MEIPWKYTQDPDLVFDWIFIEIYWFLKIFNVTQGICPNQWFLNKAVNSELTSPRSGSWTPKNIKNTSVPLKRESFVETLDPEKHKNYEVYSNREHFAGTLDPEKHKNYEVYSNREHFAGLALLIPKP